MLSELSVCGKFCFYRKRVKNLGGKLCLIAFDDTKIERISVTVKPFPNNFFKKIKKLFFITYCDRDDYNLFFIF